MHAAASTPVVLYGGTFDPVHNGHLAVARAARDALAAEVRLLPAADPPHRPPPGADAGQREAMLRTAVEGETGLRVDTTELVRGGRSYTADTLEAVRAGLAPATPLVWLLGADAFRGLPQWHRWPALLDAAHWLVALRPGHALDALPPPLAAEWARRHGPLTALAAAPAGRMATLVLPLRHESATAVRGGIGGARAHDAWEADVPAAVARYIRAHRLYA
ncbi:nicotinate-nucleotide adenylyltransferase [Coralloluteibacterium stylophorae]|nr:nicotinate-nucleotide adenylyltransferase [Coralloluteibacterium stylophorae]